MADTIEGKAISLRDSQPAKNVAPRKNILIVTIIGGIVAATLPIYPLIDLLLIEFSTTERLTGYGWAALFGALGQIVCCTIVVIVSQLKYTVYNQMKKCIIACLSIHGVSSMDFFVISIMASYGLYIYIALVSLGAGITANVCFLFLYPIPAYSPASYSQLS